MKHFPSPFGLAETRRLAALHKLDLLDTAPEREFDAIVRLAGAVTGCPTAFLSLVDRDRLWVKASIGHVPAEVSRKVAVCDTTIRQNAPLIVEDLAVDPHFRDNPFVIAGTRFYAGLPLRIVDRDGVRQPVGTLCAIDTVPQRLSGAQRANLDDLVTLAEALMESRGAAREAVGRAVALQRQQRLFDQAERMAKIGWWRFTLADDAIEWSDGTTRIHGLPVGSPPVLHTALDFYPPQARAIVSTSLAHTIETGQPFDLEVDFRSATGEALRVRSMGEVEWTDGRPSAIIGVFRDVSAEHTLTQALRHSAETDALTGISNRAAFSRRLGTAVDAARDDGTPLALVLIDLDGFKRINDTFGHPAGDEVLKAVAQRLHAPWLAHCCAARLGGDEFAVVVDDAALVADLDALASRLTSELCVSTTVGGLTMETGASVGATRFDRDRFANVRDFIHASDAALYATKRQRVGERRAA